VVNIGLLILGEALASIFRDLGVAGWGCGPVAVFSVRTCPAVAPGVRVHGPFGWSFLLNIMLIIGALRKRAGRGITLRLCPVTADMSLDSQHVVLSRLS
jgi:hypothetical protein